MYECDSLKSVWNKNGERANKSETRGKKLAQSERIIFGHARQNRFEKTIMCASRSAFFVIALLFLSLALLLLRSPV